ncbi:MAG: dipeptidase [Chloroflexota bacterium]|jgi:acetylornithine deacetylase/succinyl-diaminopimelate desuccinylase-like protein
MTDIEATSQSISQDGRAALGFAADRREDQYRELVEFLRIPSISTQAERSADVEAAANWLALALEKAGLNNTQVIKTSGHPLVYADWLLAGPNAPTLLIYGHYDVQPPDPLHLWNSPPFEPKRFGDYLHARGASDDKGQLYVQVKAVEAYLKSSGRLPVNVKFVIEGEEESGGKGLNAFVPANKELLAADSVLVSDTHIAGKNQPSIVYGLRGMTYAYLDVTGPSRDLHSGSYGGGIDNPLNVLAHIIAKLKTEDGTIQIPGFYDRVRELTAEEKQRIARGVLDEDAWLADAGAPQSWGEPGFSLLERLGARPTLDVNGIIGGYTEAGAKTVLPSTVHAKISMRLVPDQDPDQVFELFQSYVSAIAPSTVHVECTKVHVAEPCIIDVDIPQMQAAAQAYLRVFGKEPVFMREGGSIPVISLFQRHLGIQTILMGFGLGEDRIHSPNERMYMPNFYRGIETAIQYYDILGA